MLSPSHALERPSFPGVSDRKASGEDRRPESTRLFEADAERRESIVSKRTFYMGVLAAAAWDLFVVGTPLWSLAGVFTLLVNAGVGAAFIWVLLEPPYLYTPHRRSLGRILRRSGRALVGRSLSR